MGHKVSYTRIGSTTHFNKHPLNYNFHYTRRTDAAHERDKRDSNTHITTPWLPRADTLVCTGPQTNTMEILPPTSAHTHVKPHTTLGQIDRRHNTNYDLPPHSVNLALSQKF